MSEKPARAIKLNVINEPKDSYTGGPRRYVQVVATTKYPM